MGNGRDCPELVVVSFCPATPSASVLLAAPCLPARSTIAAPLCTIRTYTYIVYTRCTGGK